MSLVIDTDSTKDRIASPAVTCAESRPRIGQGRRRREGCDRCGGRWAGGLFTGGAGDTGAVRAALAPPRRCARTLYSVHGRSITGQLFRRIIFGTVRQCSVSRGQVRGPRSEMRRVREPA